jgi:hypothetical protein
MNKTTILMLFLAISCGCQRKATSDPYSYEAAHIAPVSIIRLVSTPERYNGKRVNVIGFCNIALEANAIYLHQEDYRAHLTRNAIRIEISPEMEKHKDLFQNKYVWVIGTFDGKDIGGFDNFSGSIKNVESIGVHALADGTTPTNEINMRNKRDGTVEQLWGK